jgi:hypothetical protein
MIQQVLQDQPVTEMTRREQKSWRDYAGLRSRLVGGRLRGNGNGRANVRTLHALHTRKSNAINELRGILTGR